MLFLGYVSAFLLLTVGNVGKLEISNCNGSDSQFMGLSTCESTYMNEYSTWLVVV